MHVLCHAVGPVSPPADGGCGLVKPDPVTPEPDDSKWDAMSKL